MSKERSYGKCLNCIAKQERLDKAEDLIRERIMKVHSTNLSLSDWYNRASDFLVDEVDLPKGMTFEIATLQQIQHSILNIISSKLNKDEAEKELTKCHRELTVLISKKVQSIKKSKGTY